MFNLDNHGILTGRLVNMKSFTCRDSSKRMLLTIAVQDNFRNRQGTKAAQFIPVSAFVPSSQKRSIYDYIYKGDKISVAYSLRNNNYRDKNGNMHYEIEIFAEDVKIQEPKSVTDARHANLALATETAS